MEAHRLGIWLWGLLLLSGGVFAQQLGESVLVRHPLDRDLYAAGREVAILAPVAADAVVAGQVVRTEAAVGGDLIAAGESVTLGAPVGDDVRVAGRRVVLNASVGDHVVAAGESVLVSNRARIGGFLWVAGDSIRLEGPVGGELRAAAREVVVEAEVLGDALIMAERIIIGPGARIQGDLIWRSDDPPRIDPAAQIGGRTIQRPLPAAPARAAGEGIALFLVLAAASVLVAAIVLYLLFPGVAARAAEGLRRRPGKGFGVGALLLLLSPVVIALLFATSVGTLLALIALALYLVALPVGWITGAFVTADLGLSATGKGDASRTIRTVALVLAVIALGLLQLIPVVGFLIGLTVLLAGLGALSYGLRPAGETAAA